MYASRVLCMVPTPPTTQVAPTPAELWQWCLRADAVAQCYIRDVMALRESEQDSNSFWWLGTVPCRCVRFVGIIVGAKPYERRTMYTVDDGTGVIQCVHVGTGNDKSKRIKNPAQPSSVINEFMDPCYSVGNIVRVSGRVERWHDIFQIFVNDIEVCKPNDEPRHWIEVARLHETYYSHPFVIPALPLPPSPKTPVKLVSQVSTFGTPDTVTTISTPSTTVSTSTPSKASEFSLRLRHPSRLRSAEYTSNTFKIYLKNYMEIVSHSSIGISQRGDMATPKPKFRPEKSWQEGERTPRASDSFGKENVHPLGLRKAFTLSYLRRVPELADMALRVVEAETRRRAREQRRKLKEAALAGKTEKPPEIHQEPARSKAKRLYVWAIRELYKEGGIILNVDDGPVWEASAAASHMPSVWRRRKTGRDTDDDAAVFKHSIDALSEEKDSGELSDPPHHEESYFPFEPSLLIEPIMDAIKSLMARKRGKGETQRYNRVVGPTTEELRVHVGKLDARWENVGEYAIEDALQLLKAQDRVYKVGKERWEIPL